MDDQTIAALATPPGRGGLAVVRLSGPESAAILNRVIADWPATPQPWRLYHRSILAGGRPLSDGLAVFFRAPRSYSGEDAAEISIPSSPLLTELLLEELFRQGARPAMAGEFTYRAFRNGRIDLIQAEAVQELVQANSRSEALMEFATLEGQLSKTVNLVREKLIELAVRLETTIEFQEENQLDEMPLDGALAETACTLSDILSQSRFSELARIGLSVAIAGRVNAGKSTLFNALLLRERAITSPHPGTTRDYIQETLQLDGFPVELSDAAGIRSSGDPLEVEGVRRSRELITASQAVLMLLDATCPLNDSDEEILRLTCDKPRLLVVNKSDVADPTVMAALNERFGAAFLCPLSALTGANLDAVRDWLRSLVRERSAPPGTMAVNRRQKKLLEIIAAHLQTARSLLTAPASHELAAEELRGALAAIGELTGAVSREDLLQTIFGQFCVGK